MKAFKHPLLLASRSPRRKEILERAGFTFSVTATNVEESWPKSVPIVDVPEYLAEKKAQSLEAKSHEVVVLTADTIVVLGGEVLEKPQDEEDAIRMLHRLSGRSHTVITGFCVLHKGRCHTRSDQTQVHFRTLTDAEIRFYIRNYSPLDKAGGYGVQDFIGMVGVTRIEGSFYNVMGLPVRLVYEELQKLEQE